jgi:hypothetical protein
VISNLVPLLDNSPNDLGISFGVLSDNEECRFDVPLLEDVQQLWREGWVRTVVKGHRQDLLIGLN